MNVSAALISEVTDSVLEEVKAWQYRPLEALYPIVCLDALMVKMRQDGKVENRAVYTAISPVNLPHRAYKMYTTRNSCRRR